MPTVLRSGPYRVYFVSHDLNEPPPVHVDRNDQSAKFWFVTSRARRARNLGLIPSNCDAPSGWSPTMIIHARTSYTFAGGRAGSGRYTDVWQRRSRRRLAVSAHVTRC